ncbi:MAG: M91 family zinc metallopeptidase [Comamonadaceae bacterium]|nr:M91 family zinc metallopeptidase [Comamonadaceae bacterium]
MSMTISQRSPHVVPQQGVQTPKREEPVAHHAAAAAPGVPQARSETLTAMARHHHHGAGQAVGQTSQAGPAQTPLDAKVRATDKAVASFTEARSAYRAVAARPDANANLVKTLKADMGHARAHVKQATGEELNLRASALQTSARPPAETHYKQAAQAITQRYDGQPAQQRLLQDTLGTLAKDRAAAVKAQVAPERLSGDRVTQHQDKVTIETGAGHDRVKVTQSKWTGDVTVSVNGRDYRYQQSQVRQLEIKTNGGNDVIQLNTGAGIQAVIHGGAGDDRITAGAGRDTVYGGAGHDYLDGGAGDDTLLGQDGADTIYGGTGHDTMDGGRGDDYLDGFQGNDVLSGGWGKDVLSGGRGDDSLRGNSGNDVIYTGLGRDKVEDQFGNNKIYHQAEDQVSASGVAQTVQVMDIPGNLAVQGSVEFTNRTMADLETLAASPTGHQMLDALAAGRKTLTVRELQDENGYFIPARNEVHSNPAFHLGRSPEEIYGRVPPIVVLYHEMGHAQAYMNGTSVPYNQVFRDNTDPYNLDHNRVPDEERRNVGLPRDHDNNPNTKAQMDSRTPYALTENGLRDEMGYAKRGSYAIPR